METLWQDLRYGWRMLRRSPGFAATAVLTLALGIGANAAIFCILYGVVLKPVPFPDASRIIMIWETDANRNISRGTASPAEFLDWRDMNRSFEELSAWHELFYTLTGNGEPEQVWGAQSSGNFFRLFGVKPSLGRDFSPEEEQPGHDQVVILSYGLWQRRYGGDRGAIGKSIVIDDKPRTIIGILPRGFSLYGETPEIDLWTPFAFERAQLNREDHEVIVFGRLRKEVVLSQAQAEMETILARLKAEYPRFDQKNGVRIVRFQDDLVRNMRPALLILFAAVGFVLLIACANVANLMLARAAAREKEIAVRAALGAGRNRLLRQLLTESMLLALIGGALGILVAYGGLHLLSVALLSGEQRQIPFANRIGMDGTVLGFTLAVSLLTGILFGLAPAFQTARVELHESLKEGSRGSSGGRRSHFVQSALVVSEVALSVMLLVGAGLLIRSFVLLMSENLGLDPSNVLTMQIYLPESHYADGQRIVNFYQQVIDQVAALPGVKSASAANYLPLTGWIGYCNFDIEGRATPPSGDQFTGQYTVADWRYPATMKIPVKEGRGFTNSDGPDSPGVVLINETLARRYWPNEDPVGKQIRLKFPPTRTPWEPKPRDGWITIVGIVGDVRDWEWGNSSAGQLYLPYTQNPSRIMRLVLRSDGPPAPLALAVRHVVENVDAGQPITDVHLMSEYLANALSQRRLSMFLLGIFAAVATLLACIGIYGVMAYAVTQRAHEIGIRMALGAQPGDVQRMIVTNGMRLAGIGILLGMAASFLLMSYLQSQLYGIKDNDPITFTGVAVGLALVSMAACYIPARRATKVDPIVALRHE